ncbi:hypothetical protein SAV31267_098900 [Streptomyces avermitilis]|uniref:Uncharacterized protein n=1 Tax=Streptomyces avermitilis TaxID=33903 RepID=A0A4D4NAA8_STRAX|nr:hypothetical protein SAV31267_098900 [Streptomyces avermitilis]
MGQPFFYRPQRGLRGQDRAGLEREARRAGFVTRFEVESQFLRRYPVRQAGGQTILELWVPAAELDDFNAHMAGEIEVVHEFR